MSEQKKTGKTEGIRSLNNKFPKWNDRTLEFYSDYHAFVLNFHGRVDKPSVKNFQLIEPSEGNSLSYSKKI